MDKSKFNPTIVFVTVAVLVFIIILVLILRSGSDDSETVEAPATQQPEEKPDEPSEPGQPEAPKQPEQPTEPSEPETPEQPVEPQPPVGQLPADWDSLTSQQKTDRNPFDCDIETQYVRADNGTCIDRAPTGPQQPDNLPPEHVILHRGTCIDLAQTTYTCQVNLAIKGSYDADDIAGFWEYYKLTCSGLDSMDLTIYRYDNSEELHHYYWDNSDELELGRYSCQAGLEHSFLGVADCRWGQYYYSPYASCPDDNSGSHAYVFVAVKGDPSHDQLEAYRDSFIHTYGCSSSTLEVIIFDYDEDRESLFDYSHGIALRPLKVYGCRQGVKYAVLPSGPDLCVDGFEYGYCTLTRNIAVGGNPSDAELEKLWQSHLDESYFAGHGQHFSLNVYDYNGSDSAAYQDPRLSFSVLP